MNRQMEEERERQMDRETNVSLLKSKCTLLQRQKHRERLKKTRNSQKGKLNLI